MAGNPVLMAMTWYADMEVIDGVLTTNCLGYDGGHCMFVDEEFGKILLNTYALSYESYVTITSGQ